MHDRFSGARWRFQFVGYVKQTEYHPTSCAQKLGTMIFGMGEMGNRLGRDFPTGAACFFPQSMRVVDQEFEMLLHEIFAVGVLGSNMERVDGQTERQGFGNFDQIFEGRHQRDGVL